MYLFKYVGLQVCCRYAPPPPFRSRPHTPERGIRFEVYGLGFKV